jgi:hypothetical protein
MISVAMTTYNGADYVATQLQSILNQSVEVDEVIIFDDCSTDDTADVVLSVEDSRVKFIRNTENVGYIQNFYNAIKACTGDFIFLADQDDVWEFDKVEKIMQVMKEYKCEAVCTNFSLIDKTGCELTTTKQFVPNRFFNELEIKSDRIIDLSFDYLMLGNVVQGATYCISKKTRELYLEIDNRTLYHDHQLLLIASKIGKVCFLNEKLIRYRIHEKNTIGFGTKTNLLGLKRIKFPKLEPSMVTFLKQLNRVSKVQHYFHYIVYYYFRVPSIKNIIKTLK